MKKKLVVLTGAGISAESGIRTFRDQNGLWEGHDVMEVASPEGWRKNKSLVLDFYNQRRKEALKVQPNQAHMGLAELERWFDVTIVTQNIDNLHEKAGSSKVIHLHGEILKSQSSIDPSLVYEMDHWEIKLGDKCEKGSQLRPFVVWFGEMVPMMEPAMEAAMQADLFAVVGTSLLVYPAAGLVQYTPKGIPIFIIDKKIPETGLSAHLTEIEGPASSGVEKMKSILTQNLE
ncbi:NAD-dependent deacylase [Echinicola jeungdonensis]|uniref:NAD-dependent protein deacylase n=1 Tax=Echinicola jeungdonensis TaxID=709343 RepID=A0ABV5J0F8_9BACT|nr:NAD-dependent deacylase [Echinicola jeungdonensis]MDN3671078.1 NAD-dependent deacylase [Echinicola jeungdonensis]